MAEAFLLDAPSLVYRAFFALPQTVQDPHGRPVNAVRGFMEMVTRLITERRPDRMVAVFDDNWRPAFRVAAYSGYKSARPDDPPALPRQFTVLEEVLDAAGIPRAAATGFEADDAIAALVSHVPTGDRAVIVTGDRDLLCLVRDPDVGLLFTVRGVSDLREFRAADVEKAYGVPPALYCEFAMLRGDPSDGLPGVPGIGPVRAAALLSRYGSIDQVLAHSSELPPRQATSLEAARNYLVAMRTVVPPASHAPVHVTERAAPDEKRLRELAEEHNLGSSAVRLAQALRGDR